MEYVPVMNNYPLKCFINSRDNNIYYKFTLNNNLKENYAG